MKTPISKTLQLQKEQYEYGKKRIAESPFQKFLKDKERQGADSRKPKEQSKRAA